MPTGLVVKNGWNSFGSSLGRRRPARRRWTSSRTSAGVDHPDEDAAAARGRDSIACCALMTKFRMTCSSSVKFACTFRVDVDLDLERRSEQVVEVAAPKLDDLGDRRRAYRPAPADRSAGC